MPSSQTGEVESQATFTVTSKKKNKEPITGRHTLLNTLHRVPWTRPHGNEAEHQKMIKASAVCELAHSESS